MVSDDSIPGDKGARSVFGRVGEEGRPSGGGEGQAGAFGVLRVADVDGDGGGGEFDAGVALAATAVAALEPRQVGGALGRGVADHVSPSSSSIKALDSRGVRAW